MIKCEKKKQQRSSKDATKQPTFGDMVNVDVFNIASICIHSEKIPIELVFLQSTGKDRTMKQMSDISAKLVSEQDEINGEKTFFGKTLHGCICL